MKIQMSKAQNQIEPEHRAFLSNFEIRSKGEDGLGPTILRGYAAKFGVVYDLGWFTEEISRESLNESDMSDVRALLNHDPNQILGRTSASTVRVGTDNIGLWYEVELPNSPNGENVRVAVERGDISQSSWGFRIRTDDTGRRIGDKWEMRGNKEHRIITDISRVFDVSPVTFPANPDTSVAKRSKDEWSEEAMQSNKEHNKRKVDYDLSWRMIQLQNQQQ